MRSLLITLFLILSAASAFGEQFIISGGATRDTTTSTVRREYGVSYLHEINPHTMVSLAYVNEGHQQGSHRDGIASQFWLRTGMTPPKMVFAVGAGPYVYFDTHVHEDGSHHDLHGLGARASATATWYGLAPFLVEGHLSYIVASRSFDTLSATVGVGYLLDSDGKTRGKKGRQQMSELTAYGGQAVLNSSRSEHRAAWGFEYRRQIVRHIDWSIGGLWEGDKKPLYRRGVVTQLWLSEPFFEDRLRLSAGIGPYLAYDNYRAAGRGVTKVEGDTTLRASVRVVDGLSVVAAWSRVFSTHDRDSDVFFGGIGYRF